MKKKIKKYLRKNKPQVAFVCFSSVLITILSFIFYVKIFH